MHKEIEAIYHKIQDLEDQLEDYLEDLREQFSYSLHNGKVSFDASVRGLHEARRISLASYIANAKIIHIVTAPVIYAMVLPLALLDITLNIYQQICFRAYSVPLVPRWKYLIIDRNQLGYLNALEKLNCVYCSYGNSVIAFGREVLARTEQYWCPIKHAHRLKDAHRLYQGFSEFGDAEGYREDLTDARENLKNVDIIATTGQSQEESRD